MVTFYLIIQFQENIWTNTELLQCIWAVYAVHLDYFLLVLRVFVLQMCTHFCQTILIVTKYATVCLAGQAPQP